MKRYQAHFIVLGLYILLTCLLTWPWIANFGSAFPGSATWAFDESTFIWNIWRFKHNLLDLSQSPLYTNDIFWPLGISLVLYTYNFLNALLGLPLLLSFNLPIASNTTILLAYVLSGYGTYLLIRYVLGSKTNCAPINQKAAFNQQLAAFVGGAIYAFAASRAIFAALGHYDIVSTGFIPFFALFFLKSLREPGLKNPTLAGLFAALCLLAEMIFGVFLLFLGLIMIAFHLKPHHTRRPVSYLADDVFIMVERISPTAAQLLSLAPKMILLSVTAALVWGPAMLPILRGFARGDFDLTGWGESLKLSADLVGWFTPTALHPVWGSDWVMRLREVQAGVAPFSDVNTVFLGYGILALATLGGLLYWREVKMWLTAALIFAIFTLGPLLQIKGQFLFPLDNLLREQGISQDITFPLPFALLHYLPIIRANRVPARFSVVLGLVLAVLVAYGVYWLLQKARGGRLLGLGLSIILTTVVLFDQLALPLPLTEAQVPDVYAQIGAETGDFALLQLPLGWRNSFGVYGAERTQIQYYQHIHQKRMIGGNISRAPAFKFDYYKSIPLFQAIAQTELPQNDPAVAPETLAQAATQAADLMTLYNVRYVVIHDPIPARKPYEDTATATQNLLFELLPLEAEPTYRSPGVAAYKVKQPPVPNPLQLDLGDWPANPYRGEGWAGNEFHDGASVNWSIAEEALLFFPYQGGGSRQISFHLTPFHYPGALTQELTFILNGVTLETYALTPSWQVLEATLPAEALHPGLNRLVLRLSQQAIPREVLPAERAIGETGVNTPVDIELNADIDFAFITIGFGEQTTDAAAHRRGVNVAVLDPTTGEVIDVRGFDTAANEFEAKALTDYIATISEGDIVLIATQGAEATAYLSEGFASVGGSSEVPRAPYALIGVKGSPAGRALESFDDAYLRLGGNPDTRPLGVAVDWVAVRE